MKKELGQYMRELEDYRTIELSESNRIVILTALEIYRTFVTARLYKTGKDHDDIELLEIDEIIENITSIE